MSLHIGAALAAAVLVVMTFYPGLMSFDSLYQLDEARRGAYTDWHPPIMAWVWRRIDHVVAGPLGMLTWHAMTFAGSAAAVFFVAWRSPWGALATMALIAYPAVLTLLSTVWKDVGLAATMLASFACLWLAERYTRWLIVMAMVPMAYAVMVRHNGIMAAAPLTVWAAWLCTRSWRRALPMTCVALGFAAWMSTAVSRALTEGRSMFPLQQVLLHDLTAISLAEHKLLLPDYIMRSRPDVTLPALTDRYVSSNVVPLLCCDEHALPMTRDPDEFKALRAQWLRVVPQHLAAYLTHRWHAAAAQLGFEPNGSAPYYVGIDPNRFGYQLAASPWRSAVFGVVDPLKDGLWFRAWPYLLLTVVFLSIALVRKRWPAVVLASSGLSYALPAFFVAPASDFRLVWWSVVVALVLPSVLFAKPAVRAV